LEFEDLYAAHLARLVTQVYFVTSDVEEARDCVPEAFAPGLAAVGPAEPGRRGPDRLGQHRRLPDRGQRGDDQEQ
jgi:DNA-directed RNA polymerase specialized sigma24 family protein